MARTYEEILNEIDNAVAGEADLIVYDNSSGTSRFGLMKRAFALAAYIQEGIIEAIKTQVQAIIDSRYFGTPQWYIEVAKQFQYGGILSVNQGKIEQSGGTEIIARAAVVSPGRTVTLKVCKEVSGVLTALTTGERNAFSAYMEKVKPAGIQLQYTSLNADRLKVVGNIYYDGQLVLADVQAAVVAALESYMVNLPFNGDIYLSKVVDTIQAVGGVKDVNAVNVYLRQGGTSYPVARVKGTLAGYVVEEDTSGQAFLDTLTFIPD